jgi:serine/threonine protein kinase
METSDELIQRTVEQILKEAGAECSVVQRLGMGGSAPVYQARILRDTTFPLSKTNLKKDTVVALKAYTPWWRGVWELRRGRAVNFTTYLDRQRNLLESLGPNFGKSHLLQLYDVRYLDETDKIKGGWILMEYAEQELGEWWVKRVKGQRELDPRVIMQVLSQLLVAVDALHRAGFIHRDLKPGNIMVRTNENGSLGSLILADFGSIKPVGDKSDEHPAHEQPPTTSQPVTRRYAAPELLGALPRPSIASDMYSIGGVIYFLIHGHELFREIEYNEVAGAIRERVPLWFGDDDYGSGDKDWPLKGHGYLREFLLRELISIGKTLLDKIPDHRPQNASALLDLLSTAEGMDRLAADWMTTGIAPIVRSDILGRDWPRKAFEILLLFPNDKDTIRIDQVTENRKVIRRLSLDVRNQNWGIYSNRGKAILNRQFINRETRQKLQQASDALTAFVNESHPGETLSWKDKCPSIPLRWASGGALPFVHYRNRTWVSLFFRDIPTRGWNIPIGASENSIERSHLTSLIEREFTEEFVIISGAPSAGGREAFGMTDLRGEGVAFEGHDRYQRFLMRQTELRSAHDGIELRYGSSRTRRELDTPFKVHVKDASMQHRSCDNIIFSINPHELGIEVIRPYLVELESNDWLLDGEILPSPEAEWPYLVRRPILLLRADWLLGIYRNAKPNKPNSLGELLSDEDGEAAGSLECKVLPEIPTDAFRLFGDFVVVKAKDGPNVDLRAARLRKVRDKIDLLKDNRNEPAPGHGKEKEALLDERKLLEKWDGQYRPLFERVMQERQISEDPELRPLRSLCPVTWKTLELMLQHVKFKS